MPCENSRISGACNSCIDFAKNDFRLLPLSDNQKIGACGSSVTMSVEPHSRYACLPEQFVLQPRPLCKIGRWAHIAFVDALSVEDLLG